MAREYDEVAMITLNLCVICLFMPSDVQINFKSVILSFWLDCRRYLKWNINSPWTSLFCLKRNSAYRITVTPRLNAGDFPFCSITTLVNKGCLHLTIALTKHINWRSWTHGRLVRPSIYYWAFWHSPQYWAIQIFECWRQCMRGFNILRLGIRLDLHLFLSTIFGVYPLWCKKRDVICTKS